MRWYDYVLVFVLAVCSGATSYFLAVNEFEKRIKVVDVVGLINEEKERLAEEDIPVAEKEKRFGQFLNNLEAILSSERGLILIRQAVVGGGYEDITEEVRRKLREKQRKAH